MSTVLRIKLKIKTFTQRHNKFDTLKNKKDQTGHHPVTLKRAYYIFIITAKSAATIKTFSNT